VRVVIAEDLALLRDGLVRLLRDSDIEVVAEVGDPDALVHAVLRERPDLAIVDIRLPPTFRDEGLRAALELRGSAPETAILVLSQNVEHTYAAELLAQAGSSGGVGYLLKDRVLDAADFVDAIRRVADGGTALDPEVVSQLLGNRGSHRLDVLTPRELDVLKLMAEGRSNAAIAESLGAHGRRGREAHREHLPEASPPALGNRPPPRPRGARLPPGAVSPPALSEARGRRELNCGRRSRSRAAS
jgi:DNA-binding NarL/FixJ family response regulator